MPFTVRQWELSPPQTPHLSSCFREPTSLSQPTCWHPGEERTNLGLHGLTACSPAHRSTIPFAAHKLAPQGQNMCPQGLELSPGQGKHRDSPTRAPHHALAPDADAVGVSVAAAGPVVNNLVHEHHISRALRLADQLTLLSICSKGKGEGEEKGGGGKRGCGNSLG